MNDEFENESKRAEAYHEQIYAAKTLEELCDIAFEVGTDVEGHDLGQYTSLRLTLHMLANMSRLVKLDR